MVLLFFSMGTDFLRFLGLCFVVWIPSLIAQTPRLASAPAPLSQTAAGSSLAPILSEDGRYVVFASHAKNLTTNAFQALSLNIFHRDLVRGSTVLVSVDQSGNAGGDDDSSFYSMSPDGRYVAFASRAGNLVANDTNAAVDIFLRDVQARTTRLISVDPASNSPSPFGDVFSSDPQVSSDGRWVAFESRWISLGGFSEAPGTPDVFLRDTLSNTTTMVSINRFESGAGYYTASYSPKMTPDGSFVLFISTDPSLIGYGSSEETHLFLRDIKRRSTEWITSSLKSSLGVYSNGFKIVEHAISDNAQAIAFKTSLSNSSIWLFRYDVADHSLFLVSTNATSRNTPQLSGDGRLLAYESGADILIWDHAFRTNLIVNLDISNTHPAVGVSRNPALSVDGRSVAFVSNAGDLVPGISGGSFQGFWRDLIERQTFLVSANTNAVPANANHELVPPAISADGLTVAFESSATDMIPDDLNQAVDVFAFDFPSSPQLSCASTAAPSEPALSGSGEMTGAPNCVSGDGRVIAFFGYDSSLARNDTNRFTDLFLHDLASGTNRIITVGTNSLTDPEISADARYLTCTRLLHSGLQSQSNDTLRFDLLTGEQAVLKGITGFIESSAAHSMSSDGRFVAFQSTATDLDPQDVSTDVDIFVHDFLSNTNHLLSVNTLGDAISPRFAQDDKHVFFLSQNRLFVTRIDQTNAPLLVSHDPETLTSPLPTNKSFTISGNSQTVVFDSIDSSNGRYLYRNNLASNVVSLVCSDCQNGVLNGDGHWAAYESRNPSTLLRTVYLHDLINGTNQPVSTADRLGIPVEAALDSFSPRISADSRFVVFLSRVRSPLSSTRLYAYDRSTDQMIVLTPSSEGIGLVSGSGAQLQFARDGRTVVFRSFSELVKGDYNDNRDVFVLRLGLGDQDNDGLDDDWEMAYFNMLGRDGSGDFDIDGRSDLEEFRSGTDPTNHDSVLRVLTVTRAGDGTTVFWQANPGRSYRVEYKNSLADSEWLPVSGEIRLSGSTGYLLDPSASSTAQRFYRAVGLP
jgi:Tol biopolymer transport system component